LALLPPIGEIDTGWTCTTGSFRQREDAQHFELLLVPFPYAIGGDAFSAAARGAARTGYYFATNPHEWCPKDRNSKVTSKIGEFLLGLIKQANRDGGHVNSLAMPELAMDLRTAQKVECDLAKGGLEMFITGALESRADGKRNCAYVALLDDSEYMRTQPRRTQTKHHRWRLDRSQISRYHLGHRLDASRTWWEDIDLSDRSATFTVFRPDTTLAVLICEDLARVEPAQTALRAVGPNLVLALLLDGPQLGDRWPGRYATVLAEDPGSSVLSLTSVGMVNRGGHGHSGHTAVALWKEAGGQSRSLELPHGDHALLLSLAFVQQDRQTLDGRTDRNRTVGVSLVHARPIRHPNPPKWLNYR
jgi:hypothetical protein